jgi:hypothetical protein
MQAAAGTLCFRVEFVMARTQEFSICIIPLNSLIVEWSSRCLVFARIDQLVKANIWIFLQTPYVSQQRNHIRYGGNPSGVLNAPG